MAFADLRTSTERGVLLLGVWPLQERLRLFTMSGVRRPPLLLTWLAHEH